MPRCSATWRAEYSRVMPSKRGLSKYSWVAATSWENCSSDVVSALLAIYLLLVEPLRTTRLSRCGIVTGGELGRLRPTGRARA